MVVVSVMRASATLVVSSAKPSAAAKCSCAGLGPSSACCGADGSVDSGRVLDDAEVGAATGGCTTWLLWRARSAMLCVTAARLHRLPSRQAAARPANQCSVKSVLHTRTLPQEVCLLRLRGCRTCPKLRTGRRTCMSFRTLQRDNTGNTTHTAAPIFSGQLKARHVHVQYHA